MKKILSIILALLLCSCACAESAQFLLPVGLPLGATLEEVTALYPDLDKHDLSFATLYLGMEPTEAYGCGITNHNYVFGEDGGLIYYSCSVNIDDLAAFEAALKENCGEMKEITADGSYLRYNSLNGMLEEEYWGTVEALASEYAAQTFTLTHLSQYLVPTDAGYACIIFEAISMSDGQQVFEDSACYFTLLDDAACAALAADAKIAG